MTYMEKRVSIHFFFFFSALPLLSSRSLFCYCFFFLAAFVLLIMHILPIHIIGMVSDSAWLSLWGAWFFLLQYLASLNLAGVLCVVLYNVYTVHIGSSSFKMKWIACYRLFERLTTSWIVYSFSQFRAFCLLVSLAVATNHYTLFCLLAKRCFHNIAFWLADRNSVDNDNTTTIHRHIKPRCC